MEHLQIQYIILWSVHIVLSVIVLQIDYQV